MKEERIDFGILDAPANERHQTMSDGFHVWLLTDRAVGERWAKEISYIMGKILRELSDPLIDEEKAKKIALKVLTSKLSKSTKRHYLRALEHYMAYLGKPMKFKKPHDTMRCPEYLDQAQMSKLIRASRNYREMAVLTLFCTTGVRLGELVNIDIKDLDFERKNIRVRHCKMDKQREVPMSEQLERVLKMYLSAIPADQKRNPDPLFRSALGKRIAGRTVHTIVKQAADRAGLAGVHAHVLRHSFATAWVDNGGDVFHLQDVLGHADIKMTERYWHLNTTAKKSAFAKAVPKL